MFNDTARVTMAQLSTNELKPGTKVMLDHEPHSILENNYIKPGKGQAFNRIKLRNLKNNRVIERTLKSGDRLMSADVQEIEVQYLYNDGTFWNFMATETFEQYQVSEQGMGETKLWLKGQELCSLTLLNNEPLNVTPPNFVILKVVETDPGLRGDTAGNSDKRATLETGVVVRVPLFVQINDLVKVDTRDSRYITRQ
jgi:elongation factor P